MNFYKNKQDNEAPAGGSFGLMSWKLTLMLISASIFVLLVLYAMVIPRMNKSVAKAKEITRVEVFHGPDSAESKKTAASSALSKERLAEFEKLFPESPVFTKADGKVKPAPDSWFVVTYGNGRQVEYRFLQGSKTKLLRMERNEIITAPSGLYDLLEKEVR